MGDEHTYDEQGVHWIALCRKCQNDLAKLEADSTSPQSDSQVGGAVAK